jgi:PleD family two-component response regulator
MIETADQRMYMAKQGGRDRVVIADGAIIETA